MGYFWLNQKRDSNHYNDKIGKVFHYTSNVPGHNQLSEGDLFVYYQPGEFVIFGMGRIEEIKSQPIDVGNDSYRQFYAYLGSYSEIDPPVSVREIKENISFLKERDGLRGVPQAGILEISEEDMKAILKPADDLDLPSTLI